MTFQEILQETEHDFALPKDPSIEEIGHVLDMVFMSGRNLKPTAV